MEPGNDLDKLAYDAIGACIEIHKHLGPGYVEKIYEQALIVELRLRGIDTETQVDIPLSYKGHNLTAGRIDLILERKLILELKVVESLQPIHKAQLISYLKATDLNLGLLVNFNAPIVKDGIQRVVYTNSLHG